MCQNTYPDQHFSVTYPLTACWRCSPCLSLRAKKGEGTGSHLQSTKLTYPTPKITLPLSQLLLTHLVVLCGPQTLAVKGPASGWAAEQVVWLALLPPPEFLTAPVQSPQVQDVLMEELVRSWGFPGISCSCCGATAEKQLSDSKLYASPYLFREAVVTPSLQGIRQETLANFAAPPSFPSSVPAQNRGRGRGSWMKNRKLGGQAPAKKPPHKTS